MTPRRWALVIGGLFLVLTGGVVWLGLSARVVVVELTAARDHLTNAQEAITARDVEAAGEAITSAAGRAATASSQASTPIWDVAAAVPFLGATPEAVQAIATSLDQAVGALVPAVEGIVELKPSAVVDKDGNVDGAVIPAVLPGLQEAEAGISAAVATLAASPSAAAGDLVAPQVESARVALSTELASLDATVSGVVSGAEIAPPLLGVDEPKRYFMAILNPNESRGVGGYLGTYAIVTADGGRLTVDEVGSNDDLPSLPTLPADMDADFQARYGDEAGYRANMNISPHFPNAGQLWLESWHAKTGERLDGALSADVVALGQLVTAGGGEVPLPDGGSVTGDGLTELALAGIYEKFPDADQSAARRKYQEAVAGAAVAAVASGAASHPEAVASALAKAISERRVLAWVTDKELEAQIIETPFGGSLAAPDGPHVAFAAIAHSASKLDTYLTRSVRYDFGRCVDSDNRVRSEVTVTLTNDIPKGVDLPAYAIAQAEVGPDGPTTALLAQLHLPNGARILDVQADGEPAAYSPFTEQGRTSLVVDIELPPRVPRTITVLFDEPFLDVEPTVAEQPLALPQETQIVPRSC